MKTNAVMFAAVLLFSVASAQTECACERVKTTDCAIWEVNQKGLCSSTLVPCSPCACVVGGSLKCQVESGTSYQPIGLGVCDLVSSEYAVCPELVIIKEPLLEKEQVQLKTLG
mmetsp:Transcript_11822/g.25636  ORF Transcript_11822/g.25636 Transcript_11822/m.25636 type:complete len:113 (+) Transcript_11822:119-457(+)